MPRRSFQPRAVTAILVAALTAAALAAGVASAVPTSDPFSDRQWNLDTVGAPDVWAATAGTSPIIIAVVDTGVDVTHEDLADRIVPGRDIVDGDNDPSDEHGHGTHVAGIAAAVTDNGRGVAGMANPARIMPIRVLDDEGSGTARDVYRGVKWAVDRGAHVVNLSLGVTGAQVVGTGMEDAVRYAWDRGVIPVVAAGNDFVLSSGFSDEPAIVVTATTFGDGSPDYSNGVGEAQWGMAAPGGGSTTPLEDGPGIISTYWNGKEANLYAETSGTSMAAPHVAGAAAALRALGATPQETVDILLSTAKDLGRKGFDSTYGWGRLNAAKAVSAYGAGKSSPPAPAPSRPTTSAPPTTAPPATAAPVTPPADRSPTSAPAAGTAPSTSNGSTTQAPSNQPDAGLSDDGADFVAISPGGPESGAPPGLVGLAAAAVIAVGTATTIVGRRYSLATASS